MKRTGLRVPARLCVLLSLGHVRDHPWSLSLGNNPVRVFTGVDGHEMNSARSLGKHDEVWLGYSHLPHMPCVAQGARSMPAMERPASLAQLLFPSADLRLFSMKAPPKLCLLHSESEILTVHMQVLVCVSFFPLILCLFQAEPKFKQ